MISQKTRRIMMLHSSSDLYGASRILFITASLLLKNGHYVLVVLSEEGPLAGMLRETGVEVVICRLGILRRKYFSLKGMANRLVVLYRARKRLAALIREQRIDVMYSNTAAVLIGGFAARKCRVKHLWHIHEIIEEPRWFRKLIGMLADRLSDKVIVVSDEVKKHWAKHVREHKMLTVHNGMDYSEYVNRESSLKKELGLAPDTLLVGMIGRVNKWKGQEYFLRMASLLARKYRNVRFVLAGDAYPGYEYLNEHLEAVIREEQLKEVVFNLGFRRDIPNVMSGLDIFVLPSVLPDPLPTVVLEAMACARPVIATAHGGALEMVDNGKTGILIPWNEPQEAVSRFSFLLDDADQRTGMGRNGFARVMKLFSQTRYEKNILQIIHSL